MCQGEEDLKQKYKNTFLFILTFAALFCFCCFGLFTFSFIFFGVLQVIFYNIDLRHRDG